MGNTIGPTRSSVPNIQTPSTAPAEGSKSAGIGDSAKQGITRSSNHEAAVGRTADPSRAPTWAACFVFPELVLSPVPFRPVRSMLLVWLPRAACLRAGFLRSTFRDGYEFLAPILQRHCRRKRDFEKKLRTFMSKGMAPPNFGLRISDYGLDNVTDIEG